MQIYSKYRDYYDPVLYHISSLDRFVRYENHRKRISVGDLPEGVTKLPLSNKLQYLFFCGSVYPFVMDSLSKKVTRDYITRYDANGKPVYEEWDDNPSFLWSSDTAIAHYAQHRATSFSNLKKEELVQSFKIQRESELLRSIQIASGVCYFVFEPVYWHGHRDKLLMADIAGDLILYPSLQDIQFYKVVDPFSAAQQIDYWLGNIFVSDVCVNTQTDVQKIVAHGHDLKESFRDASGKSKKKHLKKMR
jgi:hypothetical protein